MSTADCALSVEINFEEYNSPGMTATHLFRTALGVNAVDALEQGSALVSSSIRTLKSLIDLVGNDQVACSHIYLVIHALQAAEALVVAVSESDVVYGKLEGGAV